MGEHIICTAQYKGQSAAGKASLELDKILFRGDFRLDIPLREIKQAIAENGELRITFNDNTVVFQVEKLAEKWAKKITSPKKLIDKLGVKTGAKTAVFNISDELFWKQLEEKTEHILSEDLTEDTEFIFIQVENLGELRQIKRFKNFLTPNGAIWVGIPKGRKDIGINDVIAVAKDSGLVDVKLVSFSATHSMYKLVIPLSSR